MRADDWAGLQTSTPQAASGRNIDIWMPTGAGERAWRKLQNEVQMQWFADELNEARELRGQKPINSLWLWGGGDAAATVAATGYACTFNLNGWPQALSSNNQQLGAASALLAAPGGRALLLLDSLQEPGLNSEWGLWLAQMEILERDWFAPLLQALRNKQLRSLSLLLSGQERLLEVTTTATSLRKFWRRPTLAKLT